MPYKPKFCCQCGEKIERVDWKLWTSRRFCELCETDFGVHDKIPIFIAAGGILIGAVGFGSYLRTPETQSVAPNQLISRNSPIANKTDANRGNSSDTNSQSRTPMQVNNSVRQTTTENAAKQNLTTQKPETKSNSPQDVVYFCGAATKKGTPCSRRVKGGGRCWQHVGQPAMLPQDRLIVNNN
ncbi:hypothetical protein BH10ACI1_BH10ACI1_06730 [soil metagenome]